MVWTRQGLIYRPGGRHWWGKSHAALPVVDKVDDQIWRIYYAARDEAGRSHISYIEVEAGHPGNILYEHPEPVLSSGKIGTFDDCGVMPSWIINVGESKYLYYIGCMVRNTIPYHNAIGLAISRDGGRTFERFSDGPLFGTTFLEPHFSASSCVVIEEQVWKIWYLSCVRWEISDGRPEPFYHLKYAESPDGINWQREGLVAIDLKSEAEAGVARPSVLKEDGVYRMWYSYRSLTGYRTEKEASYRIGYAESQDGKYWNRMDDLAGIDISEGGWDSEMIEYPYVLEHLGRKYLFYNGNGFGISGFGYAVLDQKG
ncbi:MAG TPA: hypothetical protein VFD58_15410 [Blastocatellia bacterium]|nr:hypothetical protein [Blastocatellia bacterium]